MPSRKLFVIYIAPVILFPGLLRSQSQPTAGSIVPSGSGAYYQGSSGLVPMRGTLLMPVFRDTVSDWLSLGRPAAIVDLPGPSATFRITDIRPTIIVRGFSPDTGLYLVRESHKEDFRRLTMPVSRNISQWAHFRSKDLTELDAEPLYPDVVRIRPRADLKPGDYILVSDLESRFRSIRIGFEFHILSATGGS
jgi:hypothetical protein